MNPRDAAALIRAAIPGPGGTWADLGAGAGTFTRALAALLGPEGRVYAVDRDPHAVAALRTWAVASAGASARVGASVIPVEADFTRSLDLPALDGVLLANALHFVRDAEPVLARVARAVRPGGHVVIVEYDGRPASRWVPYPLPAERLPGLAARAGLGAVTVVGERPSAFSGRLYAAVAVRPE
jgi:SAM-dependent methyltransferase